MNTTIQAQGLLPETIAESDYYPTPSNRGGPTVNSWPGPARFEPDMFVHEVFDRQPLENLPWSNEDPSHHREQVDSFGVPQEARRTTYMVTPNAHWDPHPLPGSYPSAQEECFVSPAMLDTQDDPFQLEYPPLEAGGLVAGPSQPPLAAFRSDAQSQDNQLHYYYESMGLQDQHYVTLTDLNSDGQYASKNFQSGDIDAELGYRQNINLSGEQVDGTLQAGEEPVISRAQGKRPITDVYQDTLSKQGGRDNKRRHNSSDSSSHHSVEGIESEPAEDDDSDLYQPSRSPSPPLGSSRSSRRRSHISAAQALKAFGNQEGQGALSDDGSVIIPRRNNHSIPLPVPVPNLTKKSRGRKVPSLGTLRTSGSEDEGSVGPSRAQDERSYVCSVAGCGKCFVRGEHLKRHVRSIHTHEKPHVCPYEGCHKSFSRRDNLGQHLRIHL